VSAYRIAFLDLGAAHAELQAELEEAYRRVVARGWFVLGEELSSFEEEFAAFCGVEHCVGVGSGLDALSLGLQAAGVGPGDEVVVPGYTAIATWLAVSRLGARPVPVDVDERTYNVDATGIAEAITPRTRAIVPVHLFGQPVDMDPIRELAGERELFLLEDAAQAHGARYRDRRVGSVGDAAAFSFYPSKNLGALGDGGAVTTDDAGLADRVRLLRNYGSPARYEHEIAGVNSRLDELQAALLRPKLRRLEEWNARRAALAARYLDDLRDIPGLGLPQVAGNTEPAWHLFVISTAERDRLQQALAAQGVETLIHYPTPPHRTGAYAVDFSGYGLPVTDRLAAVSLPLHPHLAEPVRRRVTEALQSFE
jgi:dTDP-3-amino-3,4,6-trideoxy-alpha-D-glucose transaminase